MLQLLQEQQVHKETRDARIITHAAKNSIAAFFFTDDVQSPEIMSRSSSRLKGPQSTTDVYKISVRAGEDVKQPLTI